MDERARSAGAFGGHPTAGAERPRSRKANWALLLGALGVVLGPLLMFSIFTPAALVYGVRALREIRAEPALAGRLRAWAGIGLGVLAPFLWVGVFVGLLTDGTI